MLARRAVVLVIALVLALVSAPPLDAQLIGGGLTAQPATSFGSNLLQNGGFENAPGGLPAGWGSGGAWIVDAGAPHSGAFSYRWSAGTPTSSQRLSVPQGLYRLTGWVRTDSLGDANRGVRLTLDFRAGGIWEWHSTPVISGTNGWSYYEIPNVLVPEAGGRVADIELENYGSPSGTAWFDDVSLQQQMPQMIDAFMLYPNFRGMLFDDQPMTMRFDVTVTPPGGDVARYQVSARVRDETTGAEVTTTRFAAAARFVAEVDATPLSPARPYLVELSLVDLATGSRVYDYPAFRVSRVPASARASMNVSVDAKNRILVRGQPRFVLGVYDSGGGYGGDDAFWEDQIWSPSGSRRLDGLRINFYLNYWMGEAPAGAMQALMANLQKRGVMYLQTGNCFDSWAAGANFGINASDAYVQQLGATPGSAGFYTADECQSSLIPSVFAQYQRLRTLAPGGMTFAALFGDPDITLWRDAVDVLSSDPYPMYGAEPGGGYDHGRVARWTAQTREAVRDARPIMTVLQFFKFTSMGRWPTRQEMRDHAYMAVVEGARGLWWWSVGNGEGALANSVCSPPEAWCDARVARMNDLRAVVGELADLEPALLAADAAGIVVSNSSDTAIRTKVKVVGTRGYVFAYNATSSAVTATFGLASPPAAVYVNAENRTAPVSGSSFTDAFGPFQAHAYVFDLFPPAKLGAITADKAAPQLAGTPITFSTTASSGNAPYQYKWWLFDGTAWTVVQDWSGSNRYTWTPTTPNPAYQIAVWVRSAGTSAATYEDGHALPFAITLPALSVGLTADRSAPQGPGMAITFTTAATGGMAPYEYKWWLWNGSAWTVLQDWTASRTYTWTPSTANGGYQIAVWVRSTVTPRNVYEGGKAMPFAIQAARVTALTADRPATQPPGTTITFTATATGGTAPYQYKWWLWNGSAWTVLQDWTASPRYAWTPSTASGGYQVAVWVRCSGTVSGAYEDGRAMPFAIEAPPLTVRLAADRTAPQGVGTTTTFTATPAGGTSPYQYKWWLWNGVTWTVLRDWTASPTYAWTPATANAAYRIAVWAHSAGTATETYEAGEAMSFAIPPATITGLSADKTAPQPPGAAITLTATATGGTAPYQYKWWLWNGTAWTMLRDWTASNTYAWTPAASNAGYQVAVWVRSAGAASGAYEDGRALSFAVQSAPLTIAMTADKAAPERPGTPIAFTATPAGGTPPYEYKWWLWTNGAWAVLRDWTPANAYTWTPLAADPAYQVAVWAHGAGAAPGAYEAGRAMPFAISPSP